MTARGVRPDPEVVHRLHDRYLLEVVEGMNLCPFARRCREQGRLARPLFYLAADDATAPDLAAQALGSQLEHRPELEIVLLTFVVEHGHPLSRPPAFEAFVAAVREHHATLPGPRFYMVAFHPDLPRPDGAATPKPHNLVPLIRRTPDPVIQCVRVDLLDELRRQAQRHAQQRLAEEALALPGPLRERLLHAVVPDSELSASIARGNHETLVRQGGLAALEARLDDLRAERLRAYGPWAGASG